MDFARMRFLRECLVASLLSNSISLSWGTWGDPRNSGTKRWCRCVRMTSKRSMSDERTRSAHDTSDWKINLVRWSRVFRVWKFFLCEVCSDHVTGHARYGCGIMEASRRYTRNSKDGLVQDSRLDTVEATCAKSLGRSKETHEQRKMKMRYVTWETICDRWLRHFYVAFVTCSACCTRSSYSFYAADGTILFPRVSNSSSFVTQSIRTQWKSDGQHPCVRQDIRDSAQTAATRAMLLVVRVSDTTNSCCKGVLMNKVLALSKKHTNWTWGSHESWDEKRWSSDASVCIPWDVVHRNQEMIHGELLKKFDAVSREKVFRVHEKTLLLLRDFYVFKEMIEQRDPF